MALDREITFRYDPRSKTFPTLTTEVPDAGISLNNKNFKLKYGGLYQSHAEDSVKNTFFGDGNDTEVSVIFNDEESVVKNLKAIALEGDTGGWSATVHSDVESVILDATTIPRTLSSVGEVVTQFDNQGGVSKSQFKEKEGKWFSEVYGASSTPILKRSPVTSQEELTFNVDTKSNSVAGLGFGSYVNEPAQTILNDPNGISSTGFVDEGVNYYSFIYRNEGEYTFSFVADDSANVSEGDLITLRVFKAQLGANGSFEKSTSIQKPLVLESVLVLENDSSSILGDNTITCRIDRTVYELAYPLTLPQSRLQGVILDSDGEIITDHTGDALEGTSGQLSFFLQVQIEAYNSPTDPSEKIIITGDIDSNLEVPDLLFFYKSNNDGSIGSELMYLGPMTGLGDNEGEIDFVFDGVDLPDPNSYFLYSKNNKFETSGILGKFHQINLSTPPSVHRRELFSVTTEWFESSR